MSKTIWNKGKPPSIGWWPASYCREKTSIRWWDGKYWSDYADPSYSAKQAAECATIKTGNDGMEWSARWWL